MPVEVFLDGRVKVFSLIHQHIRKSLVVEDRHVLAFSLQRQHRPVDLVQPLQDRLLSLEQMLRGQNVFLDERSGEHVPRAVHEVVRLVDQEDVIIRRARSKITLEHHVRRKCVIIVADDDVHIIGDIQIHLVRTYAVLFGISFDHFPCDCRFMRDAVVHRFIHTVEMPFRTRARIGIAASFFKRAQFVLRRDLRKREP